MNKTLLIATMFATLFFAQGLSAQDNDLNRDEVAALKKKLLTVQTAIGQSSKYLRNSEDFQLPTSFSPHTNGKFYAYNAGLSMRWVDKVQRENELKAKKAQDEFQQKYAQAMAKQDYAAIEKLSADLQQSNAMLIQSASLPKMDDMHLSLQFNHSPYTAIDPDAIVFESPGAIALFKKDSGSETKGEVNLYLDPVALKDTKKLAKIELKIAQEGVANKVGVYHMAIQWRGPLAEARAWAKSVDVKTLLALIDK
jgi:hypothetical protein